MITTATTTTTTTKTMATTMTTTTMTKTTVWAVLGQSWAVLRPYSSGTLQLSSRNLNSIEYRVNLEAACVNS